MKNRGFTGLLGSRGFGARQEATVSEQDADVIGSSPTTQLPPPTLEYKGGQTLEPVNGQWNLKDMAFLEACRLESFSATIHTCRTSADPSAGPEGPEEHFGEAEKRNRSDQDRVWEGPFVIGLKVMADMPDPRSRHSKRASVKRIDKRWYGTAWT